MTRSNKQIKAYYLLPTGRLYIYESWTSARGKRDGSAIPSTRLWDCVLRQSGEDAADDGDPPSAEECLVAFLLEDALPTMLKAFVGVVLWT